MPPPTSEPSGTFVELLCGHPEQKYGVRATSGSGVTGQAQRLRGLPGRDRGEFRPGTQPDGQPGRDQVGIQFPMGREQRRARRIGLARDGGGIGHPVEDLFDGRLDEGPLLLHDDDLGQAVRELLDLRGDQRMDHREPQEPYPAGGQFGLVEAESAQGLPRIEVGLARRDDADAGPAAATGRAATGPAAAGSGAESLDAVELVGQRVGAGRVHPDTFTSPLHLRQLGLKHPGGRAMLPLVALEHH